MTKPIPVQSYRLDQTGLMRLFGELEARIMDVMWELGVATIQDVCDRLGDPNYLTVTTVMNRLVFKQVLHREREGKAFVYTPTQGRTEFLQTVSQQIVQGLVRDFGALAITPFSDVVDALSPADLAQLEQAVQRASAKADPDRKS